MLSFALERFGQARQLPWRAVVGGFCLRTNPPREPRDNEAGIAAGIREIRRAGGGGLIF